MPVTRTPLIVVFCLWLWSVVTPAWGQTIQVLPKEDILLVGGDFRIRSIFSNAADANTEGGGASGGFPDDHPAPSLLGFSPQ
jgi:hypothetical protein